MLNIVAIRDRTQVYQLTLTEDGSPLNLTGLGLYLTVKQSYAGANVFQKSTANGGIVITDAAAGEATLTILAADTSAIPLPGGTPSSMQFVCDLAILNAGDPEPADRGNLTLLPNVGQF